MTHSIPENLGFKAGSRVLVTAAASGIGLVIAETFAAAGAKIQICDISDEAIAACKAKHSDWGISKCDVSNEDQVSGLFDDVRKNLGGLDILINNAGIAGPTIGIAEMSSDDWRQTIDINLNSQFYCTKNALPMLRQSDNASIICLSSVAGRFGYPLRTPYSSTKWAVVGLVKSLAMELGPEGIRVNAILPGMVEGDRIKAVVAAKAKETGKSYEDIEQLYLEKISLRKMVSAQDIANQALFLCSPMGANISGQPISVCANVESLV